MRDIRLSRLGTLIEAKAIGKGQGDLVFTYYPIWRIDFEQSAMMMDID